MKHLEDEQEQAPIEAFQEWNKAADALRAVRRDLIGRRVRYVGMFGNAELQPEGRITDVIAGGFKVSLDGRPQPADVMHPGDLVFI